MHFDSVLAGGEAGRQPSADSYRQTETSLCQPKCHQSGPNPSATQTPYTVKPRYNELGYNEHPVITNKFSGPLKNVRVSMEGARL